MKKKIYNDLEFSLDSIDYSTIEDYVTVYYKLGSPESSNFMCLDMGINNGLSLLASNGSITFSTVIRQSKDGKYSVNIIPNNIKKYR